MNEETSEPSWLNSNNVNDEDSINTPSKLKIQESHDNKSLPSWVLEEGIENNKLNNTEKDKLIQKTKDKKIKIIYNKKNNINDENSHQDDEDCKCYPSDSLLFTFQCYHFTCGLSGLLAFLSHIYSYTKPNLNIYHILMHTYIAILCLLVLFIELDWRLIVTKLKIMDIWIFRGFFYVFIGLLTGKNNIYILCY